MIYDLLYGPGMTLEDAIGTLLAAWVIGIGIMAWDDLRPKRDP